MYKYKKGDVVAPTTLCKHKYPDQVDRVRRGVVLFATEQSTWIKVRWQNGRVNFYENEDLQLKSAINFDELREDV